MVVFVILTAWNQCSEASRLSDKKLAFTVINTVEAYLSIKTYQLFSGFY